MEHPLLERLWQVAGERARSTNRPFMGVFDPIGLLLHRPLKYGGYRSTPARTLCFGSTGGDGTHFSLLELEGKPFRDSPVVMSVSHALAGLESNFVLGENLHEFLRLGYHRGFFSLEQLAYGSDKCIEVHSSPDPAGPDPEKEPPLRALIEAFDLTPWSDIRGRLAELRRQYWKLLRLPTEQEWARLSSG